MLRKKNDYDYYKSWKIYSLTISPAPRLGDYKKLYLQDSFLIKKILHKSCNATIYPEIDDNYRLHYHGVIRVKNSYIFNRRSYYLLQAQMGFCKLKLIKTYYDHLRWILYMSKDWRRNKHTFVNPMVFGCIKRLHN